MLGAEVRGQQEQHIEVECNVPGNVINNVDEDDDAEGNIIIAPQQVEEHELIIRNEVDDCVGNNNIIINEEEDEPNEVEDVHGVDEVKMIVPDPLVDCCLIPHLKKLKQKLKKMKAIMPC